MGFLSDFGSGLQSIGSVIGSVTSGLFNANQARKDRAFQERMYNKQYQDSIDFWNMQNEYNLPSAQYQRLMEGLKANGLNPYLALDGAGGVQSVAQSAPELPSQPHGSKAQANFENPFAGFGLMQAQAEALKSQVRLNDSASEKNTAEALLATENTIKSREESNKIRSEAWYNWHSMRDRLTYQHYQNELTKALANTEGAKVKELEATANNLKSQANYIDTKAANETRLTDKEIQKIDNDINIANQELSKRLALMDAQARAALAEAYKASVEAKILDATKGDPEWQQAEYRKMIMDTYEAMKRGDALEIQNQLNRWKVSLKPNPISWNPAERFAYGYQKIANWVLGPIGDLLSSALAGVGAAATR